jgi:hypothetical protein
MSIINPEHLMDGERIVRDDAEFAHVSVDDFRTIHAWMHPKSAYVEAGGGVENWGGNKWEFGEVGVTATREAVASTIPPKAYAEAYAEERDKWKGKTQQLAEALPSRRRRTVHREDGDELDVTRWLESDPACWRRQIRGKGRPSVHVGILASASQGNGEAEFARTIARAVAALDALTVAGYATRATVVWYGAHCTDLNAKRLPVKHVVWTHEVKRAGVALDVGWVLTLGVQGVFRGAVLHRRWRAAMPYRNGLAYAPAADLTDELSVDVWFGLAWASQVDAAEGSDIGKLVQGYLNGDLKRR